MYVTTNEELQFRQVLRAVEIRMETGDHGSARTLLTEYTALNPERGEQVRQHVQDGYGLTL